MQVTSLKHAPLAISKNIVFLIRMLSILNLSIEAFFAVWENQMCSASIMRTRAERLKKTPYTVGGILYM